MRLLLVSASCLAACGSPVGAFASGTVSLTIVDDGSSSSVSVAAIMTAPSGCPSIDDTDATLNDKAPGLVRAGGTDVTGACSQPHFDFAVPKGDDAELEIGASKSTDVVVTHAVHPRSFTVDVTTIIAAPGDTLVVHVNSAPNDVLTHTVQIVQGSTVLSTPQTQLRFDGNEIDVTIPPLDDGTYGLTLASTGPLSVSRCKGFATCTGNIQLLGRFAVTVSR